MHIGWIVDEFLDYRSYVSHTLCRQRLFLGLDSREAAIRRLRDASVWPLVLVEARRLYDMSSTLFGMNSPDLSAQHLKIEKLAKKLTTPSGHACESVEDFERFRALAEELRDTLTSSSTVTPEFCVESVEDFLGERSLVDVNIAIRRYLKNSLLPIMKRVFQEYTYSDLVFRDFWSVASDIYMESRIAIVAGAMTATAPMDIEYTRNLQKMLRTVERVVSCWSPNLTDTDRPTIIADRIRGEGFRDLREIVDMISRQI